MCRQRDAMLGPDSRVFCNYMPSEINLENFILSFFLENTAVLLITFVV